jgi:broad specificity phosphatase PhoE
MALPELPKYEMTILRFVTHPEVSVDANVPVPKWGLSAVGRSRAVSMLQQPWIGSVSRIVSSGETKAIETAAIVADHVGIGFEIVDSLHENDRSATGFVPPDQFEILANQFFAQPTESVQGWETAADAQARVIGALNPLIESLAVGATHAGDTLVVGHGGVGTLAYCSLAGLPIDRRHDQRKQGHYWSYQVGPVRAMLHAWLPIDQLIDQLIEQ